MNQIKTDLLSSIIDILPRGEENMNYRYQNMVIDQLENDPLFLMGVSIFRFEDLKEFTEAIKQPNISYGKGFEFGSSILVACGEVENSNVFYHFYEGKRFPDVYINRTWKESDVYTILNSEMTKLSHDRITDKIRKKYPNGSSNLFVESFTQITNYLRMDHALKPYTIFRDGDHHLVLVRQLQEKDSSITRTLHHYYKEPYQDYIEINNNEDELAMHEKIEELLARD